MARYPLIECPNCHKPVDVNGYWRQRAFAAEREIERVEDHLDAANELIAHLRRQREQRVQYEELREDGLTGRPYRP